MSEELFEKYLTNRLSEAEGEEMKRLLREPEARRRFVDFLLEWSLTADIARQMSLLEAAEPPRSRSSRRALPIRPSRPGLGWWIAGLAAAGLVAALLWRSSPTPGGPPAPRPPEETARLEPAAPPPPPPVPPREEPATPPKRELDPAPAAEPRGPVREPASLPPVGPAAASEPSADPAPPAETPPRPSAVAAVHVVEKRGPVFILRGPDRAEPEPGQPVIRGAGLQTEGPQSAAVVEFLDRSRIEAGPDTLLSEIDEGPDGKRIEIVRGTLSAEIARQPPGRPMAFKTPQAQVLVLGTRLTLEVTAESTRLEVLEGRVRLTRHSDRSSVEVRAGLRAATRASGDIALSPIVRLVRGINLNGGAVTIEGERWISHEEALQNGLKITPSPQFTVTSVEPRPPCDADTAAMLNSAVFRGSGSLTIAQDLPNGLYDVQLWVMENLQNDYRTFNIRIEGRTVARNVGNRMKIGDWEKMGPYRVAVSDGTLTIELLQGRTDPHLMGLAIYSVGSP